MTGPSCPLTGIWQLRELAKRTFVMLNERGMESIHMVHLTSALILPIVSFYTIQYDWEWHFSEGDVQDRFQREYLLAVSTGAHSGAWPIVLHEQGRSVADEWTLRTYLAVATVHELIVDPYVWDVEVIPTGDTAESRLFTTFRKPILELCKHRDVEVWRYWDERPQPVQAGNSLLLSIVYARPGNRGDHRDHQLPRIRRDGERYDRSNRTRFLQRLPSDRPRNRRSASQSKATR